MTIHDSTEARRVASFRKRATITCSGCGRQAYLTSRPGLRFCSGRCRMRAFRARQRAA